MSPFLSPWEGGGKNDAIHSFSVRGRWDKVGDGCAKSKLDRERGHASRRDATVSCFGFTGSTGPVAVPIPAASSHQG